MVIIQRGPGPACLDHGYIATCAMGLKAPPLQSLMFLHPMAAIESGKLEATRKCDGVHIHMYIHALSICFWNVNSDHSNDETNFNSITSDLGHPILLLLLLSLLFAGDS